MTGPDPGATALGADEPEAPHVGSAPRLTRCPSSELPTWPHAAQQTPRSAPVNSRSVSAWDNPTRRPRGPGRRTWNAAQELRLILSTQHQW